MQTEEGGTYDPYAAGAPLTLYATGVRNAFDLVWHSNGHLYAPDQRLGGAAEHAGRHRRRCRRPARRRGYTGPAGARR